MAKMMKSQPVQETINPTQIVFGYLVGVHKTQKPGKLLNTEYGDLDGTPVVIKTFELVEEEGFSEKPWYLDTAAGPILAATPFAYREQMEAAAPQGFQVVWKTTPPVKRGRKPKVNLPSPAVESDVPFEDVEEL